jgi:GNAT superfamily N-acetyltransferase
MTLIIRPLRPEDRLAWQPLAEGYKQFYQTPTTADDYDRAWARLMRGTEVQGLAAHLDGALVGIAHYLFHASAWTERVCYLQDLYTEPAVRGRGVARRLIETVAEQAAQAGALRYYWLTQDTNATARALYDRVAKFNGFIRYDYPLPAA